MPITTLFFFVSAVGVAAALAGATELRLSPRHALVTNSFLAYAAFVVILALPTAAYFYAFHGDWFLYYTVDVRRIPSALALFGFAALTVLFVGSFGLGATLARSQRSALGMVLVGVLVIAALSVLVVWPERLRLVGTYPQYRGGFGLTQYGGALQRGGVAMGLYLTAGTAFLLLRIRFGARR